MDKEDIIGENMDSSGNSKNDGKSIRKSTIGINGKKMAECIQTLNIWECHTEEECVH